MKKPQHDDHCLLAEIARLRQDGERLLEVLIYVVALLEDARSGYIPGSGPDLEWDKQRDRALNNVRAARAAGTRVATMAMSVLARPIETAPRDGTEVYLVSVQHGGALVSVHNGFWEGDGFTIGSPGFNSGVGDACATHWLPKSVIEFVPPCGVPGRASSASAG